jgi:hypothetical protein
VHEPTITVTDGQTGHSFVYRMRFGGKCLDLKGTKAASGQADGWRHINPWNHASESAYECANLVSYHAPSVPFAVFPIHSVLWTYTMFWSSVTRRKASPTLPLGTACCYWQFLFCCSVHLARTLVHAAGAGVTGYLATVRRKECDHAYMRDHYLDALHIYTSPRKAVFLIHQLWLECGTAQDAFDVILSLRLRRWSQARVALPISILVAIQSMAQDQSLE